MVDHLFGELSGIQAFYSPEEALAHLDRLDASGAVDRSGREYRLADEPDVADAV